MAGRSYRPNCPSASTLPHRPMPTWVQVYGPEASMTGICEKAIQFVKSFDANGATRGVTVS